MKQNRHIDTTHSHERDLFPSIMKKSWHANNKIILPCANKYNLLIIMLHTLEELENGK
jgi:hypothetical protein